MRRAADPAHVIDGRGYIALAMASRRAAWLLTAVAASVLLALPPVALAAAVSLTTPTTTTVSGSSTATTTTDSGPSTVATPVSSNSGGLTTLQEIGIFVAAAVLIGAIAYGIRRDAHAHAPAALLPGERVRVDPRRAERAKREREKVKAARRARRRSR
jgi:beta-lactamase regulating signal transducer with metallopeptidase domain